MRQEYEESRKEPDGGITRAMQGRGLGRAGNFDLAVSWLAEQKFRERTDVRTVFAKGATSEELLPTSGPRSKPYGMSGPQLRK